MANSRGTRAAVAATLIGFCVVISITDILPPSPSSPQNLRRFLLEEQPGLPSDGVADPPAVAGVFPWARNHLRPVDSVPEPETEVVVFWHVPRSGGTNLKSIYECMGRTIAHKAGVDPRYGHASEEEVIAFRPWPGVSRASYVNVDTTSRQGVERARRLGVVPSGLVDMIVTSNPTYVVENLFDEAHKGRALALFRHPVDRLVSQFYYLREATWEHKYRPQWKDIDVLEFARAKNTDNNHLVKRLAGLGISDHATEDHLRTAMRTIKKRFFVGLTGQMEESVRRFNIVMGVDESEVGNRQCLDHFFHNSVDAKKHNSNSHPKVEPGSATWNAIIQRNALDMRLYDFILQLFDEQKEIIDSYSSA